MKYDGEEKFVELLGEIPNVAVQGYNKERKVIYWNKASEKIYGFTKEEVFGKKLEDLIIPDFMKELTIEGINNWFENKKAIPSGELILKHKNGSEVHVYSSHVLLKEDSNNPEMFCIDVDLSERVKKDLELKKKEKILFHQSKMAAMGDMIGSIAHQWRQPLSAISTAATGTKLQKELDCLSDEQLNNALTAINESAQYLSSTIDDFREFFKPASNKIKEVEILNTFDKTLKLISAQFVAKDVEIIQNIENHKIFLIENELIQVLINILNNARDALLTKKNQKRLIFINSYKKDNSIYIEILDNAGGISSDIINRVFEAYFTTKEKSIGTGIGLYMSRDIIQNHLHGSIEASNTDYLYEGIEYKGAKFTIKISIN